MDDPRSTSADAAAAPRPAIRLTGLHLYDFRNYEGLSLTFDRPFAVLTGPNGAGKTNLLEAISLLSPGRGLRRAAYSDMLRQNGGGAFSVRATHRKDGFESQILTTARIEPDGSGSRVIKIDGTQARASDELLDLSRLVWLTPAMDGLFTGPAADRRRFVDRMVLSVDPGHGRRASDFERAMRSRNRLLSQDRMDDRWLEGLELQMAELGVAMAIARHQLIDMLTASIAETDPISPFPQAGLLLASGFEALAFDRPAVDIEEDVRLRLRQAFSMRSRKTGNDNCMVSRFWVASATFRALRRHWPSRPCPCANSSSPIRA